MLEYIREFIVLASYLNYHDASESLCISQSTLSRHIAALERELGCRLFRRSTVAVELTETGEAVLGDCERLLRRYELIREKVADMESGGCLRIGGFIRHEKVSEALMGAIEDFEADFPGVPVRLTDFLAEDPAGYLANGLIDLAVSPCFDAARYGGMEIEEVAKAGISLWMSREDPLFELRFVSIEDLAGRPLRLPAMKGFQLWNEHLARMFTEGGVELVHGAPITHSEMITLKRGDVVLVLSPSSDPSVFGHRGDIVSVPLVGVDQVPLCFFSLRESRNVNIARFKERFAACMERQRVSGKVASRTLEDGLSDLPLQLLSKREMEVFEPLSRGASNLEIAESLCISVSTVKKHVHSILEKLGLSTRTQVVYRTAKNKK